MLETATRQPEADGANDKKGIGRDGSSYDNKINVERSLCLLGGSLLSGRLGGLWLGRSKRFASRSVSLDVRGRQTRRGLGG